MSDLLWISMAVLVVISGILVRRGERGRRGLSDDMVRQIESTGRIEREDVEPLDVERARAEEDEFWAQDWDEPESLGDPQSWK